MISAREGSCKQRTGCLGGIAAKTRIIRIVFCHFLIGIFLAVSTAPAISQTRVYHVGVLTLHTSERPPLKGLRDGLREAGYIEGKNLLLETPLKKNPDELRAAANTFVNEKRNAIVTLGNVETRIASETTKEIPVVFMPASDPVRAGFVKSLARPDKNLTGLTYAGLRESGKQLQIFREIVPTLRRVGLLIDAQTESPIDETSLTILRNVAAHLMIELIEKPVKSIVQAEQAVSSLPTDGIFITCNSLFADLGKVAAIARQKRVSLYGCSSAHVTVGALFTYAPDMYQLGRRGSWYVDRILKGARPQGLPIETPRKFELAINLKTAAAIGIKIPPEVLQRADKVIR
jgi:putative tryptophan/tyrosine transport system substrate-binding protein